MDKYYIYRPSELEVGSAKKDGNGNVIADTYAEYEEGEWTPTISFPQQGSGATYSSSGYYRRVGDMVYISARYDISTGITNTYYSGGLPYTPSSDHTGVIKYIGFAQNINPTTKEEGSSVTAKYFIESNTLFSHPCCVILASGWYKIAE